MTWPWLMRNKPPDSADSIAKLQYIERGGTIVFSAVFCLVLAALGAVFVARVAREEYAEMKESNLRDLIQGTQGDIRNKQSDDA
jgi:hypothetical protein